MEKTEIKTDGYMIGFLDGYLLTREVVEKELAKCNLKKTSKASYERLDHEFRFIQAKILGDRISEIRRQLDML